MRAELAKRILSAIILIPIVVWGILALPWIAFAGLTALILLLAAWEWSQLAGLTKPLGRTIFIMMIAMAFVLAYYSSANLTILIISLIWWLLATLFIICYPMGVQLWAKGYIPRSVMGILAIVPCWVGFNTIRFQQEGSHLLLYILIVIWSADTGAYFAGKYWGKIKLIAKVSPGKTVEGLLGGLLLSMLAALLSMQLLAVPSIRWPGLLMITLASIVFSVIGDLLESALKRQAGVKDSGNLLPGHGGLLDRIDSLLAAIPVFALGLILVKLW